MKKKTLFLSVLFITFCSTLIAQSNYYYYYKDAKVFLTLNKTSFDMSAFAAFQKQSLNTFNIDDFTLKADNTTTATTGFQYTNITFSTEPSSDAAYFQQLATIKSTNNVRTVSPNFIDPNGKEMGLSDFFYVRLHNESDYAILQTMAAQKNATIVNQNQFMPLWYTLRCTENTTENTLELANQFFETGQFASAFPDLLVAYSLASPSESTPAPSSTTSASSNCSTDPGFQHQWGLYNAADLDADINICDAWSLNLSRGAGVTVAVLDTGIQLDHIDLAANMSGESYNTNGGGPSEVYTYHGTHVAGIITAAENGNQIVGVAPESTLLSVSNPFESFDPNTTFRLANGINWAWQNGADIINNSWGSGSLESDALDEAIDNALTLGRDGKGTVMVFATHNQGTNQIVYPANSNPALLAVGASTNTGNRWPYSNYGQQISLVAPGENIYSTLLNNTVGYKHGTSMAAPHVSGVAALVLAMHPALNGAEVKTILETTAQKINSGAVFYIDNGAHPNGSWHQEFGYGLVDAHAAVQRAKDLKDQLQLDAVASICHSNTTTIHLAGNTQNYQVDWELSSNVIVAQNTTPTNTSITVQAISATATGNGWVKATINNSSLVLTENFIVFTPSAAAITLESFNSTPIYTGRFTNITARYNNLIDVGQLGYTWEWVVPSSQIQSNSPTYSYIHVSPLTNATSVYIKVRACDDCGCSDWKGKWFTITAPPGGCTDCPTGGDKVHFTP